MYENSWTIVGARLGVSRIRPQSIHLNTSQLRRSGWQVPPAASSAVSGSELERVPHRESVWPFPKKPSCIRWPCGCCTIASAGRDEQQQRTARAHTLLSLRRWFLCSELGDDVGDVVLVEDVAVGGGFEATFLDPKLPPLPEETEAVAEYKWTGLIWRREGPCK